MLCWSATQDCENIKGAHSLQDFLLRKSRFDRYHTGAMPRARNRLWALVGHVKGLFALSFSPDARATFFFSVLLTLQPLYSSVLFICPKKMPKYSRLKGLSQVCTFRTSPRSPPFVRPSISLVLPVFSQDIYQRQWRVGDCAIEQQRTRSVWVSACGSLDTLSALL